MSHGLGWEQAHELFVLDEVVERVEVIVVLFLLHTSVEVIPLVLSIEHVVELNDLPLLHFDRLLFLLL